MSRVLLLIDTKILAVISCFTRILLYYILSFNIGYLAHRNNVNI